MIKKNTIVAFAAGMATVMCATVAAQQFGGLMFPDVLPNDYFFDSVTRFAKKGIVNGYNNGSFSPHDYVTRGQVTVIVDRYDQQVVRKMRDQIELMRNILSGIDKECT